VPTAGVGQDSTNDTAVIRFHLASILQQKGWSPYRLARMTGLTVPTAYRLADPTLRFGRFTADTLDRLCAALDVQPGELLEWVPDEAARRRRVPQVRARAERGERSRAGATIPRPAASRPQRRRRPAAGRD
jgi:putative transcriptional regulator